ncbi:MAG TPA: caspase family protein [Abditibacterium sp.]|jgi:uncharacterized caspase-like protein
MKFFPFSFPAVVALAVAGLFCTPAQAVDRAIVVGVNQYPFLEGANLAGCVNDAKTMKATFEKYGFVVTMLADDKAKKADILGAIKAVAAEKPGRFAFYFAGHGFNSSERGAVLLVNDTREGAENFDLTADELNRAVRQIPTPNRSILLDSCFSGGMTRSAEKFKAKSPYFKTRYYSLRGTKQLILQATPQPANNADSNIHLAGVDADGKPNDKIFYFAAARENEKAGEDDFGGQRHGVFTYYLTQKLKGQPITAGDLQAQVSGLVSERMEGDQHPTISPNFANVPLFGASSATKPPIPVTKSLWDIYNGDHVDKNQISLSISPNKSTFTVGESLSFNTEVGGGGYLVLLEKDTEGNLALLYPTSRNATDGQIKAGERRRIPQEGWNFSPAEAGTERLRALLFSSEEIANKLLSSFPKDLKISPTELKRSLVLMQARSAPFYTSDIIFEVVPKQ